MADQEITVSAEHFNRSMTSLVNGQTYRRSKRPYEKSLLAKLSEETDSAAQEYDASKPSLFRHLQTRETYGLTERRIRPLVSKHLSTTIPLLLREHELHLGDVNKVFAAQWVDANHVVLGTKCNKILIKDLRTDETIRIPSIKGSGRTTPASCPCGIHAISVNPSRSLLATGADHTNDLAVYRLPSFDPVFLGEGGHTDWIFDLKWVDDEYCVTGSRDSNLAIWKIGDDEDSMPADCLSMFDYTIENPNHVKRVNGADKIRALAFNSNAMEMGVLSLNSKIVTWDICRFQLKKTGKLPHSRETVCMAYDSSKQVYAVGSQSNVTLMDRDLKPVINIEALKKGCGIRSVSFNENIVVIGTGQGNMLFYDMNAGKYLHCTCGATCSLEAGDGYLLRDDMWRDYFSERRRHNAIYAHCYDDTGSRLFAAGGPLPAGLIGNYAGIWQ